MWWWIVCGYKYYCVAWLWHGIIIMELFTGWMLTTPMNWLFALRFIVQTCKAKFSALLDTCDMYRRVNSYYMYVSVYFISLIFTLNKSHQIRNICIKCFGESGSQLGTMIIMIISTQSYQQLANIWLFEDSMLMMMMITVTMDPYANNSLLVHCADAQIIY